MIYGQVHLPSSDCTKVLSVLSIRMSVNSTMICAQCVDEISFTGLNMATVFLVVFFNSCKLLRSEVVVQDATLKKNISVR